MNYPEGCKRLLGINDEMTPCKRGYECSWPSCKQPQPIEPPTGIADWAVTEAIKRAKVSVGGTIWDKQTRLLIELAASLIEQYEQPPVDPLTKRAREIAALHDGRVDWVSGKHDHMPFILAIKQALSETRPQ